MNTNLLGKMPEEINSYRVLEFSNTIHKLQMQQCNSTLSNNNIEGP